MPEQGTVVTTETEARAEGGRSFAATVNTTSLNGTGAYTPILICLSGGTGVGIRVTRIAYYIGTSKRVLILLNGTISGGTGTVPAVNRFAGKGQTAKSIVRIPASGQNLTAIGAQSNIVDDQTPASGQYVYDRTQNPYIITGGTLTVLISGGTGIAASGTIEWDEL